MMKSESCPLLEMVFTLKKKCAEMDEKILEELNLHQSELLFFTTLGQCEELTSATLGKEMKLSPSRVSRIVDKLVNNGYLKRETASVDRRAIQLELTTKGREVYNRINEFRKSCEVGLMSVLSEQEATQFRTILEKINREM